MPGKIVSFARSLAIRFSRSSSFTDRCCRRCSENSLLERSSPSVWGRRRDAIRKLLAAIEAYLIPYRNPGESGGTAVDAGRFENSSFPDAAKHNPGAGLHHVAVAGDLD